MKRLLSIAFLFCSIIPASAEDLNFCYSAKADLVSCYIWRGKYNGGLSFQPDFSLGWDSEHTSFSFGTWWNVGASDWMFRNDLPKTEDSNPNTQLTKELDIYLSVNLWGATVGLTHYYYFDGKSFFNFGNINDITGSAQTEVSVGYDFSTLLPNVNLQLSWNTMVSGDDGKVEGKRCFSTYIEASYCQPFKNDFSLTGVLGVSPWKSIYTDVKEEGKARDFAVNNITLRLDKSWSLGKGAWVLTAFAQGTVNTCNLNKDNAIIKAAGDDKLDKQKLMGALGVNIAFGGGK